METALPTNAPLHLYRVSGHVAGGKYLGEYRARTAEEAVEMALPEAHVSICHYCSPECEDAEIQDASAERCDGTQEEHSGSHFITLMRGRLEALTDIQAAAQTLLESIQSDEAVRDDDGGPSGLSPHTASALAILREALERSG